jgi:hypothetical protein
MLHRLAALIPWNRFLGSKKVKKLGLGLLNRYLKTTCTVFLHLGYLVHKYTTHSIILALFMQMHTCMTFKTESSLLGAKLEVLCTE